MYESGQRRATATVGCGLEDGQPIEVGEAVRFQYRVRQVLLTPGAQPEPAPRENVGTVLQQEPVRGRSLPFTIRAN